MLELLMGAQGAVISSEELLARAWDEAADPFSNVVKVTVSRLRRKLGEPRLDRDGAWWRLQNLIPRAARRARSACSAPRSESAPAWPRPVTLRLRLTLLYGSVFIAAGAGLLAVTYGLFKHSQNAQNHSVAIRGMQFKIPPRVGAERVVALRRTHAG